MNPATRRKRDSLKWKIWMGIAVFNMTFLLAAFAAFLSRSEAHQRLERAFANNLLALGLISDIRVEARRLAWVSEGRAGSSAQAADAAIRRIQTELQDKVTRLRRTEPSELEAQAIAQLSKHLSRHGTTRDAVAEARTAAAVIDTLADLRRVNREQLEEQRRRAKRVSFATFGLTAVFAVLAAWVLALWLSREVVQPISELTQEMATFSLDQPWTTGERRGYAAELSLLADAFRGMAARVRLQYEKIKKLGDMRSRLVSMVSHEYGNAMTGVLSGSALLEEEDDSSPERRKHLAAIIKANALTLVRMAEEFLALAKGTEEIELQLRPEDAGEILRGAAAFLSYQLERGGMTMDCALPKDLPLVRCHRAALSFVFGNLLSNAVKYSSRGMTIRTGLRQEEGDVRFWVQDEGMGMDPETLQAISGQAGYRSKEARAKAAGFGVGLTLARDVIEAHGGKLSVESEKDKGTRFSFRLRAA